MNARHQYHYSISFALLIAAGLWGLFWIPQRALESGGLTGGWATISQMIIPFLILLPVAFWRKYKGNSFGLDYPIDRTVIWRWYCMLREQFSINRCGKSINSFLHNSSLDNNF
jgi:hypothetical protein